MEYRVDDFVELIDEEIKLIGDFPEKEITGMLQEVMQESAVLFVDGKSVAVSDVNRVFLLDEAQEKWELFVPDTVFEQGETSFFSAQQIETLVGEEVKLVHMVEEDEVQVKSKIEFFDAENKLVYLTSQLDTPIALDDIVYIYIKDENGEEVELVPDNYFPSNEEDEYLPVQFRQFMYKYIRLVLPIPDSDEDVLEFKGKLIQVDEVEEFLVIKEFPTLKILVTEILEAYLITNNGDEQYIVPVIISGEDFSGVFGSDDKSGVYTHDLLNYLLGRFIKLRVEFEVESELKGELMEVNEGTIKLAGSDNLIPIEQIDAVFAKDSEGVWDFISPIHFDYRNNITSAYKHDNLQQWVGKKMLVSTLLPLDGVADIPGIIESVSDLGIVFKEAINPIYWEQIVDIYTLNAMGINGFVLPETGEEEDKETFPFSQNELITILMRTVKLFGSFGDKDKVEGLILKCFYNKGYLILSENPQKAIPFTSVTKYEFLSN